MDPDATLGEMISIGHRLERHLPDATPTALTSDVEQLLERLWALDEWLGRGGYLPQRWRKPGPTVSDHRR